MEDQDIPKFSWSGLFGVTAVCTFLFSVAIRLMDGEFSSWLLILSAVSGILGFISWGIGTIDRHYAKKKKNNRFAS